MKTIEKIKCLLLIIIFVLSAMTLAAQDSSDTKPYVTKIRSKVEGSTIVLTWANREGVSQDILIYKYSDKISEENIGKAEKIATLTSDKESYIYTPTDINPYYFAVAYADSSGAPEEYFIEYRNITNKAVNVETVETPADRAAQITNLQARLSGDAVILSFTSSKPERELMLFRSTTPITTPDELIAAGIMMVVEAKSSNYKDYPIAGIEYYYSLMDAELVKLGEMTISSGQNTTATPISLPVSESAAEDILKQSKRSLPLPLLSLSSDVESGGALVRSTTILLPGEKQISQKTEQAVSRLLERISIEVMVLNTPEILSFDKADNLSGPAFTLQQILSDYFKPKNYSASGDALQKFLKVSQGQEIEARARFYLGQVYYFLGKSREAFLEFLLASDVYYIEAQPWIDSTLQKLIEEGN